MNSSDPIEVLEKTIPIVEKMGVKVLDFKTNYAKLALPIDKNMNHIGSVYAGSLFTLAEMAGGAIFHASFDNTVFFPIVKNVSIRFRRMATTDVTVEVEMSNEMVERIRKTALAENKADYDLTLEIKDESGEVCSIVTGTWQMRKK